MNQLNSDISKIISGGAPRTAKDCYVLIHDNLKDWIVTSLEYGFEYDPVEGSYLNDLIKMADTMAELEEKMKG